MVVTKGAGGIAATGDPRRGCHQLLYGQDNFILTTSDVQALYAIFSEQLLSNRDKKKISYLRTNIHYMLVERTNKEVIIRLSASVDTEDLQDFLNYARYMELTSDFKVDQKVVDKLADQVSTKWWTKNRKKLLK